MKRTVVTLGLFFGIAAFSNAQNTLSVKIEGKICINEVLVHYADKSHASISLGCQGSYSLDTGKSLPDGIIVNGVVCSQGETTVTLPGGKIVTVLSLQDESKGFSSLIR